MLRVLTLLGFPLIYLSSCASNVSNLWDKPSLNYSDGDAIAVAIKFESMIVDNASMQMVSRPQQFDVMLMPNLYGNIISSVGCGIVGGAGLVSGVNIGDKYAVFETGVRSAGTALTGKDIANPTAFIRAGLDMLRYLGLNKYADLISDALFIAITDRHVRTADMQGSAKSSDLVNAVIEIIGETRRKSI